MKTIHLIFNAHLDPIWLWGWQEGLDEALCTCRTVCDLLEANPDLIFTRGEAWVYQQIERIDPQLFARIRMLIHAKRWEPVGGWYIQPDCNLPTWRGLERQIAIGKSYFEERLGGFPEIAYNVDSFGHMATLPTLMHNAGQRFYIMMRPQENEMTLPARLFRWKSVADAKEVVAFRIADCYCTPEGITRRFVEKSLTELPEGIDHTMCFIGLGDHGGGPSQTMIDWCRQNQDFAPGVRLEFSSPSRFFQAVAGQLDLLPEVTGELQYHSVGCYSVMQDLKLAQKRTERRLEQAEACPKLLPKDQKAISEAWEWACFHQFHDTLGGTSLLTAYHHVFNEIGAAEAVAERAMAYALRRKVVQLPPDRLQRLVCFNPASETWNGWVETEPWLEWTEWGDDWRLLDENDEEVPFQEIEAEAMHHRQTRMLFHLNIPAGGTRIIRIEREGRKVKPEVSPEPAAVLQWEAGQLPELRSAKGAVRLNLVLREDKSDTWSHNVDRYDGEILSQVEWTGPVSLESGPLRWAWTQEGTLGERSTIHAEWRLYAGSSEAELILRIHWHELHRIAKLELRGPGTFEETHAGVPGGGLRRASTGREFPLSDWLIAEKNNQPLWGVACPEVFAADVTSERIAVTLLRSAIMAHHDPNPGISPRREYSDQGRHIFRFYFDLSVNPSPSSLQDCARRMMQAPLIANTTAGMPRRYLRGEVGP
ncbi:glycoside hydrolase family 38 C-terminal domain-containing protein [Coraliomargarita sp. SDUM461004]|uniref:Glycoside hydrolase family 38 C-terminal domain-containing protein n=1 Tax=Thalassobacterium sedimentorum TaxID=3041258 RepID=A0ABU1AN05_9BACT|nr:hypothetical protein [Coraliomargarita sp. SDUM461004]MDQ8196183.1 glycoside hydrolase family 38 C-terminal domain-containing protein [Coraliomargarita sp. SDUM461004]